MEISVAGTIDEEQPTAVSEKSTVKKTLEEGTSPAEISSAEQIFNPVLVVTNESEAIKQAMVKEMADEETMTESVQSSFISEEKKIVEDQSSLVESNEESETNSVAIRNAGQETNEDVTSGNEGEFSCCNKNISIASQSDNSEQLFSIGNEDVSDTNVAETAGQESQQPIVVSENASVEEEKAVDEDVSQATLKNELNFVRQSVEGNDSNPEPFVTVNFPKSGLLRGMENYCEYPARDECVIENSSNESSNKVESDDESATKVICNLDSSVVEADASIFNNEVYLSLELNDALGELDGSLFLENVGDEQTAQVQQSLGTENDSNVEAVDVVREDIKAKIPENGGETTRQEQPKENPNTAIEVRQ